MVMAAALIPLPSGYGRSAKKFWILDFGFWILDFAREHTMPRFFLKANTSAA
jgi:hypothetical protein